MITFDKDEHIVFEVRRHWFLIATELSVVAMFAIIPLFVLAVGTAVPVEFYFGGNFWAAFIAFYSFWLLICWITGFIFWTNYFLDVWIVTNKKLIDIEQLGLFQREISVLELDKIQDVTSEVHGIVATLMDFGKIHVQTAGTQREFVISDVEHPSEVREKLHDALIRYRVR